MKWHSSRIHPWTGYQSHNNRVRRRPPRKMTAAQLERQRLMRATRRVQGVCTICGTDTGGDHKLCRQHREELSKVMAQRRRLLRSQGRCERCGARAVAGRSCCAECLERCRVAAMARRAKRIAQGDCPLCGLDDPRPTGQIHCDDCLELEQERRERRAARRGAP